MSGSLIDESKEMEDPLRAINGKLLPVLCDSNATCDEIRAALKLFKHTYEPSHHKQAAFWLLIAAGRELAHPRAYDRMAAIYRTSAYGCDDISSLLRVYYTMFLIEQLKRREESELLMSPLLKSHIQRCRMHAENILEHILGEQHANSENAVQ